MYSHWYLISTRWHRYRTLNTRCFPEKLAMVHMVHIVTNIVTGNWYLLGYQFRTQGYLVMPVSGLATSHVIKMWLQSFHVLALICSSFACNNSWHTCVCSAHLSKWTILTWFHHFSTWICTWHLSVRTLWYHSLRHQTGNQKIIFDSSLHFARERKVSGAFHPGASYESTPVITTSLDQMSRMKKWYYPKFCRLFF